MDESKFNRIPEPGPNLMELYFAFQKKRKEGTLLCEGQSLVTSFLKEGDNVIIEAESLGNPAASFVYKITDISWGNLSITYSHSPSRKIIGRLDGAFVPTKVANQDVMLIGSGYGGSLIRNGTIEPGGSFYLQTTKGSEFAMPETVDYGVARKDSNGTLQVLKPEELNIPNKGLESKQNVRAQAILSLIKKFGFNKFDFLECKVDQNPGSHIPPKIYEDKTFLAQCTSGRATGNEFSVFNKKTRQMVVFKYYNFNDENVLQVAYADLTDSKSYRPEKEGFAVSKIYSEEIPIVTFTTSPSLDLDGTTYHVGKSDAMKGFNISSEDYDTISPISMQLLPPNKCQVFIGFSRTQLERAEGINPGITERIKKAIITTYSADDKHMFQFGEARKKIKSIEDLLQEIDQQK